MTIRVGVFLCSNQDWGGVYQYSQSILEALSRMPAQDFKVICWCATDDWKKQCEDAGFEYRDFRISFGDRLLSYLWTLFALPIGLWRRLVAPWQPLCRKLAAEKCDVWIFPSIERWGYLAPVRAVCAVHDLMHRYERRFPEFGSLRLHHLRDQCLRNISRRASGVLVDSECGQNQLMDSYGVDSSHCFVLPYVPPKHIYLNGTASPSGLPKKFFFYPAQFWPHKNHARLIRAAATIRLRCPDLAMVFTGGKSREFERLQEIVAELKLQDNIRFLGYVDEKAMRPLYQKARALIMPTFFGPTNIPPLEAFVCGCPVAISNIYGIPEQVGDAALLFDPESEDSIAAAMERLWNDDVLCATLSQRGFLRAEQNTIEKFSLRLQNHLATIMDMAA